MDSNEALPVSVERVSLSNMGFVILLKEHQSQLVVPIFIGASEAHSISTVINGQDTPRPLSHDLFKNMLTSLDGTITSINITDVSESTFFAQIHLLHHEEQLHFDSRPSDAIALALRFGCPILLNQNVLDSSGIEMDKLEQKTSGKKNTDEEATGSEDNLQQYQSEMKQAIAEERYEDAAKIRDQILDLQKHQ
jgi:bifunctional DNase/RNase